MADLRGANLYSANLSGAFLNFANLNRTKLRITNLSNTNLYSVNLRGADFSEADLSGATLLHTDLRQVRRLAPQQLESEYSPFLCNVALPKGFTVNPNRDCDRLPPVLFKRYPESFITLKDAEEVVNQMSQQKWTDEPPGK